MNKKIVAIFTLLILMVVGTAYYILTRVPSVKTGIPLSTAKNEKIKIGYLAPLSGDDISYGLGIRKGVDLALRELNLEDTIQLVDADARCNAETGDGAAAMNKLVNQNVVAVIGEVCSGATLEAAPIANAHHIVLISPASTSPDISSAGDYVFRTVPSDSFQGNFGAKLVYDKGYHKLAILYSNEPYGTGFAQVLKESYGRLEGTIVAEEPFTLGAIDFKIAIDRVKARKPDSLYIISNSIPSAVAILLQMKKSGLDVPVFSSESLKDDSFLADAGQTAEGMVVTSVSSGSAQFVARYKNAYKEEPIEFAAQGYDAMYAINEAIRHGARDGEAIKNFLHTLAFKGVSGKIQFDQNGDVMGNYDVYVVHHGTFELDKEHSFSATSS